MCHHFPHTLPLNCTTTATVLRILTFRKCAAPHRGGKRRIALTCTSHPTHTPAACRTLSTWRVACLAAQSHSCVGAVRRQGSPTARSTRALMRTTRSLARSIAHQRSCGRCTCRCVRACVCGRWCGMWMPWQGKACARVDAVVKCLAAACVSWHVSTSAILIPCVKLLVLVCTKSMVAGPPVLFISLHLHPVARPVQVHSAVFDAAACQLVQATDAVGSNPARTQQRRLGSTVLHALNTFNSACTRSWRYSTDHYSASALWLDAVADAAVAAVAARGADPTPRELSGLLRDLYAAQVGQQAGGCSVWGGSLHHIEQGLQGVMAMQAGRAIVYSGWRLRAALTGAAALHGGTSSRGQEVKHIH